MCKTGYGVDLEDSLGLGAESDRGPREELALEKYTKELHSNLLKRVRNAMFLKEPEQVGWVLVYDNVFAWDMDAEAVWGKIFAVLVICQGLEMQLKDQPTYPSQQSVKKC